MRAHELYLNRELWTGATESFEFRRFLDLKSQRSARLMRRGDAAYSVLFFLELAIKCAESSSSPSRLWGCIRGNKSKSDLTSHLSTLTSFGLAMMLEVLVGSLGG